MPAIDIPLHGLWVQCSRTGRKCNFALFLNKVNSGSSAGSNPSCFVPRCPVKPTFNSQAFRVSEQPRPDGTPFSVILKPENGASVSLPGQGIRSYYFVKAGEKKSAPDSFTVTPFLKSLVAVRTIEDN